MTKFDSEFDYEVPHETLNPKENSLEDKINLSELNVEDINENTTITTKLKTKIKNSLWQATQLGAFGVAMEVIFNSARYAIFHDGNIGLKGHSYAWMFPIWMSAAPAYNFLAPKIQKLGMLGRGAIYGGAILGAEYLLGYGLRESIGICPWSEEYAGVIFSINDLIRLDWFPLWAGAGLAMEQVWKKTQEYKTPKLIENVENKEEIKPEN